MAQTERNSGLDILKACCIVFVIITHDKISEEFRLKALFNFWIDMAVPLFLIVSGYVYALSFERNSISKVQDAYKLSFVVPKFIRYTVPYLMAFTAEVAYRFFAGHDRNVKGWIWQFFEGGWGPGSYYYPILLQFIAVYPFIHFLIRKHKFRGLIAAFFITAAFEFCKTVWHCNGEFYRLLLFRYTFVIAFGAWLLQCEAAHVNKAWWIASFLAGITFIVVYGYVKVRPRILIYWTNTSFAACLYVLPVAAFLIKKLSFRAKPVELIGRASYNIFLAQMFYWAFLADIVNSRIEAHWLKLCVHVALCVSAGLLFYAAEQPVTKALLKVMAPRSVRTRLIG